MRNSLATKLTGLSSLALSVLLVTGAGCMSTNDNANLNTNTTTVPVNNTNTANTNTEDMYVDDGTNTNTDGDMIDDTSAAADEEAAISIVSPADGATVDTDMALEVAITDFTLEPDEIAGANAVGHGHYHIWVDGEYFAQAAEAETTVEGLTAGEHEIMVSLQNNDHSDLEDAITSEPITVIVE